MSRAAMRTVCGVRSLPFIHYAFNETGRIRRYTEPPFQIKTILTLSGLCLLLARLS